MESNLIASVGVLSLLNTNDTKALTESLSEINLLAKNLAVTLERLGGSQDSFVMLIKRTFQYLPDNIGEDLVLNVKHQGELTIQTGEMLKELSDKMIDLLRQVERLIE